MPFAYIHFLGESLSPPGIWGGGNQPFPTPPIFIPPGGPPLGTWGGAGQPFPTPPIAGLPGLPGYNPPGIWGGGNQPFPTPPIVIPLPPGEKPPDPGNGLHPSHPIVIPPADGGTGNKALVFVYVPGAGGVWFLVEEPAERPPPTQPQPKK